MNGATTSQAHGERLVVAITEGDHATITSRQHLESLGHHGALHTSPGDRPRPLTVGGDGQDWYMELPVPNTVYEVNI